MKHVGRIAKTKKRCCVVYRVVPGDATKAIVVMTESLDASEHDALINLVQSQTAQDSYELGQAMARAQLPDGRNMLAGFHSTGKFAVVEQENVEMLPDNNNSILLSELNKIIAEQQGVTIADLAIKDPNATDAEKTAVAETTTDSGVLTDEDLAAQYRSQADAMFKEAKRLREQAEELVPTKRKTKTTESA